MNAFYEKTLEEIIFEKREVVAQRGLDIFYKNTARQLRFGKYIFDMFTWEIINDTLFCRIIELKKEGLNRCHLDQILCYTYNFYGFCLGYFKKVELEAILIGTNQLDPAIKHTQSISNILRVFEYSYGFDGISFKEKMPNLNTINEFLMEFEEKDKQMEYETFFNNLNVNNDL